MRDIYPRRLTGGSHSTSASTRSLNDSSNSFDGSSRSLGSSPPRSYRTCDSLSKRSMPLGSPSRSFRTCDALPRTVRSMPLSVHVASSPSYSTPHTPTSLITQEEEEEEAPNVILLPPPPSLSTTSTQAKVDDEPSPSPPTCTDITCSDQNEDCPICLNKMNAADIAHKLQCPNTCGYNFCRPCIESLINSSKDDFKESSDGNMHVKIYLTCPSCRSDLSSTIRDTVLLRKADHVKSCSGVCDEKLTPSERRMKYAMRSVSIIGAIADAREREAEFFGKKNDEAEIQAIIETSSTIITRVMSDDSEDYDDCGSTKAVERTEIDVVTQEAKVTPRRRSSFVSRRKRTSISRSSIYQLIDEAKKVRDKKKMNGMKKTEISPTRNNGRANTGTCRYSSNEQTSRRYGRGRMTWW